MSVEYTSSVARLRAEYLEMREAHFGFTDLYAAEWDRIMARHDAAIGERIALAIEGVANSDDYVWVSARQTLNHAASIARTSEAVTFDGFGAPIVEEGL